MKWQMQEAKARFAELVQRAGTEGPQVVTHRGKETAVVLSVTDYRKLAENRPRFVDHLLTGPTFDDETIASINERATDRGREIDL